VGGGKESPGRSMGRTKHYRAVAGKIIQQRERETVVGRTKLLKGVRKGGKEGDRHLNS